MRAYYLHTAKAIQAPNLRGLKDGPNGDKCPISFSVSRDWAHKLGTQTTSRSNLLVTYSKAKSK